MTAIAARPGVRYHDAVADEEGEHAAAFPAQTCRGARLPAATVLVRGAEPIVLGRPEAIGDGATMTVLAADGRPLPDVNANSVVVSLRLPAASCCRRMLSGRKAAGSDVGP